MWDTSGSAKKSESDTTPPSGQKGGVFFFVRRKHTLGVIVLFLFYLVLVPCLGIGKWLGGRTYRFFVSYTPEIPHCCFFETRTGDWVGPYDGNNYILGVAEFFSLYSAH